MATQQQQQQQHLLATTTLAAYRTTLLDAVALGERRLLVIPHCLWASFVLPTLWLTIPHTNRPWLYQTRWLVVAIAVVLSLDQLWHTSSTNLAASYAAGMVAVWGNMLCFNLLIWTRPQFDAARVLRIPKVRRKQEDSNRQQIQHQHQLDTMDSHPNGLHKRNPGDPGVVTDKTAQREHNRAKEEEEEYEYIWQCFPAHAKFLERLGWASDLILSFRGSGWNWSIPSIPSPPIPQKIRDHDPVQMDAMPHATRSGYTVSLSETDFVFNRLKITAIGYLILDLLSTLMVKDPYFILGPDSRYTQQDLPRYLQGYSPALLLLYREILSLAGVLTAISSVFSCADLAQYYLLKTCFPSRHGLWMFPSTFGTFSQVLNRGLAGFWGAWWHQTFRAQFLAPATYLMQHGYLTPKSQTTIAVSTMISFAHSALLHSCGSTSTIPQTKVWRPAVFFILQAMGIFGQQITCNILNKVIPLHEAPRIVRRASNLAISMLWLYCTSPLFIDDLASTGLWMLEPVPISIVRGLGFGHPSDHWWRWDYYSIPRWHIAPKWWQSGIAV